MTYVIHRYPAELIDVVHLIEGGRVTVRPVLPQDADMLQTFVRDLSAGSRRNRFFRFLHELPSDLLDAFTSVDYRKHLALVAEVFEGGVETIIGEARYVVQDDGTSAEFAVSVADAWQGRGIGTMLLQRLMARAAEAGLGLLFGQTLASNGGMQRLARKAGFTAELDPVDEDIVLLRMHFGHRSGVWSGGTPMPAFPPQANGPAVPR
jgi:RimJ/RimL family protein N-acetyltransferase